jgi:putative transcriptional regulator
VIFVTEDHDNGSVGLILNKPTTFSLKQVLESKGYDCLVDKMVYMGGPVNSSALVMIHSDTWYSSNTMVVRPGVSISSDNLMVEKIAMGDYPPRWRFVCGISGWGKGQLRAEIEGRGPFAAQGPSWLTVEANDDIIFRYDGEKQWHKAVELCSQTMMNQFF